MNRWFPRVVLAVAGALVGALCIAMAEAWSVSRQWSMSFGSVLCGDFAVLVPLATPVGIAVWASAGLLDPHGRRGIRLAMSALAALRGRRRAWAASIALVAPPVTMAWLVGSAHAARSAFAFGEPPASGVEAAVVSVVFLVFGSAAAFAVLPVLSRSVIGSVNPFLAAGCGLTYAAAATLIGIRTGDASGNGFGLLAIFGVLARPELDLFPVIAMVGIALAASLAERSIVGDVSRSGGAVQVAVGGLAVIGSWTLVVHEAYELSVNPQTAQAIESSASLGHLGLALARRATDRDNDGASALFGGEIATMPTLRGRPTRSTSPETALTRTVRVPICPHPARKPCPTRRPSRSRVISTWSSSPSIRSGSTWASWATRGRSRRISMR